MVYQIKCRTVGNPDFGQYAPISVPEIMEAETIDELRIKVQGYMDKWSVGTGNWPNPVVKADGKRYGKMYCNGVVLAPWETGIRGCNI